MSDAPQVRQERCDTCRYWVSANSDRKRGLCHRYPPANDTVGWPMLWHHQWCGEHAREGMGKG